MQYAAAASPASRWPSARCPANRSLCRGPANARMRPPRDARSVPSRAKPRNSCLSVAELEVRIHLPPAGSLLRTPIEPGATRVSREPDIPRLRSLMSAMCAAGSRMCCWGQWTSCRASPARKPLTWPRWRRSSFPICRSAACTRASCRRCWRRRARSSRPRTSYLAGRRVTRLANRVRRQGDRWFESVSLQASLQP